MPTGNDGTAYDQPTVPGTHPVHGTGLRYALPCCTPDDVRCDRLETLLLPSSFLYLIVLLYHTLLHCYTQMSARQFFFYAVALLYAGWRSFDNRMAALHQCHYMGPFRCDLSCPITCRDSVRRGFYEHRRHASGVIALQDNCVRYCDIHCVKFPFSLLMCSSGYQHSSKSTSPGGHMVQYI